MASTLRLDQRTPAEERGPTVRREDWLRDGVLSGFIATAAMTAVLVAAYLLARAAGDDSGNRLQRWFWGLTHNPVTRSTEDKVWLAIALNLAMGMVWALLYGRFVEPRLTGRGWRKGALFSLGPWVLSVVAFLPIMGGGILGRSLDAGPLPVLGNLILHLVYGAVLGAVYAIALEEGLDDTAADRAAAVAAERGAAIGGAVGVAAGAIVGALLSPSVTGLDSQGQVILAGTISGAALGLLLGSLVGADRESITLRH